MHGWSQCTCGANTRMEPAYAWNQHTRGASTRVEPVHVWNQHTLGTSWRWRSKTVNWWCVQISFRLITSNRIIQSNPIIWSNHVIRSCSLIKSEFLIKPHQRDSSVYHSVHPLGPSFRSNSKSILFKKLQSYNPLNLPQPSKALSKPTLAQVSSLSSFCAFPWHLLTWFSARESA